ncbi:hypothetical protein ACUNWD_04650 [Sunxiuqinia sp. A32]|uniref:hypothetical protein n=1 Tax=Sunxiuqinia sp. A32 TaxID=3461496 RepID=UPI0040456850
MTKSKLDRGTVITNEFLRQLVIINNTITSNKFNFIFNRKQDIELDRLDMKMYQEANSYFFQLTQYNIKISELLDHSAVDENKVGLVGELSLQIYYIKRFMESRPLIRQQLKDCSKLLCTDICRRNVVLKEHILSEKKLLETVLLLNPVNYLVNALNLVISEIHCDLSQRKRYIIVSEIMHELGIYENKPFLTLELADKESADKLEKDHVYDQDGSDIIYDRIKKIIKNYTLNY